MTSDSIDSTLFNRFSAFFAFIAAPENSAILPPCTSACHICGDHQRKPARPTPHGRFEI